MYYCCEKSKKGLLDKFGDLSNGESFYFRQRKIKQLSNQIRFSCCKWRAAVSSCISRKIRYWGNLWWNDTSADNFNEFLKKYEDNCWNLIKSILSQAHDFQNNLFINIDYQIFIFLINGLNFTNIRFTTSFYQGYNFDLTNQIQLNLGM